MGRIDLLRDLIFNPQMIFLEELQPRNVLHTLLVATFCAIVIYFVYRYFHKGALYSESFNLLIVMVCVVTSLIIITIGTNLVLTLGMVGALSVVRFRAAVKDPLDVGFLFWGVAAGLTAGARLFTVALVGTAFIAVMYIAFVALRLSKSAYLIIVRYADGSEAGVAEQLNKLGYKLKNKTTQGGHTEITAEIRFRRDTDVLGPIKATQGVESVTLVEYTGDYA